MKKKEFFKNLSPEERDIIVDKGTEKPFSGKYNNHFEKGIFLCRACSNPLFESATKFNSGCGWPSFDEEIEGAINRYPDYSGGKERVEICCAKCNGHLGHVFKDGPKPTGLRYCINSVSMDFRPDEKKE